MSTSTAARTVGLADPTRQQHSPSREPAPELIWVGDGAWVARDPAVPDDDARGLVAYVEHKDQRVYVLWVRDRRDVCEYASLREAITAIASTCAAAHAMPALE